MKKYLAELVGTFILVLFGCGTAVVAGDKVGKTGCVSADPGEERGSLREVDTRRESCRCQQPKSRKRIGMDRMPVQRLQIIRAGRRCKLTQRLQSLCPIAVIC